MPDPDHFPAFDEDLRRAGRQETELFFETVLHDDLYKHRTSGVF